MASYLDNPQLLGNFSPFIQQLPIEAMTNVGIQRQQKYDEGIQRIQGEINNVAGLPITKEIQKQYLQSKLNDLGSKLKTFVGADYSQFQLQNSVMGMTDQIVKDPVIQNAVYSTEIIRKGQQDMEVAKQSGKSSPQNEAFWSKQVGDWENDNNLTSRFNGSYIPYTDVDKKLREIGDKIHETDSTIDIPYKRDANGEVLRDKNNRPIVDDAMLSIKTKGKPAEKILANFMDSLDENDQQQLHIDSWYHYRGATANTFKNDVVSNYSAKKKMMSDSVVNLNMDLQNPKLTTAEKSQKQAEINDISKQLSNGSLENEMQSQLSELNNPQNLDSYKYKLYTGKYLTNLAKDLSNMSYSQELKSNPYAQMDMDRKRLQFSYDNMARTQSNFERQFNFDVQKWTIEQQQKAEKDYNEKYGPVIPGTIPTNFEPPTLGKLNTKISGIKDNINALDIQYAPLITDSSLSTPQQKKAYLDKLSDEYMKNPATIDSQDNNMRKYLEQRRQLNIQLATKSNVALGAEAAGKQYDEQLNQVLSNEKGISTLYGAISAKDLFEVNNAFKNAVRVNGQSVTIDGDSFINQYRGTNKEYIARALSNNLMNKPITDIEKEIVIKSRDIGLKYAKGQTETLNKQLSAQSEYLKKYYANRQPSRANINIENKANQSTINSVIGDKVMQLATNQISEKFDPDEVKKLQADKETKYSVERNNEDGSGKLYVINGSKVIPIPLTSNELSLYFPDVARRNPLTEITQMATFSPKKTTNLFGGSSSANAVNAYLSGYSPLIPQLNNSKYAGLTRFDVEADPNNNGSDSDDYQIRIYVDGEDGWKSGILNTNGYVTNAGLQQIFSNIGTKTIEDFLKQTK